MINTLVNILCTIVHHVIKWLYEQEKVDTANLVNETSFSSTYYICVFFMAQKSVYHKAVMNYFVIKPLLFFIVGNIS